MNNTFTALQSVVDQAYHNPKIRAQAEFGQDGWPISFPGGVCFRNAKRLADFILENKLAECENLFLGIVIPRTDQGFAVDFKTLSFEEQLALTFRMMAGLGTDWWFHTLCFIDDYVLDLTASSELSLTHYADNQYNHNNGLYTVVKIHVANADSLGAFLEMLAKAENLTVEKRKQLLVESFDLIADDTLEG